MNTTVANFEQKYRKPKLGEIRSGDTVRVHQTIREAGKSRTQVFEGTVIHTRRLKELAAVITVRRLASGVGVEKSFLLHSPNVVKVEVVKRSKVRRNYLSYMRARSGKATRLSELEFDKVAAGVVESAQPESEKVDKLDKEEAAEEAASKKEQKSEKQAEADEGKDKVEAKEEKKADKPVEDDKTKAKKEKAEAFRKAQEEKKK